MVFYKVLCIDGDKYLTPYQYVFAPIGEVITARGKEEYVPREATIDCKYNGVLGGYIHLFRTKKEALSCSKHHREFSTIIVKAIVEKGTEYFSGIDDVGRRSVAVKKVKYELI